MLIRLSQPCLKYEITQIFDPGKVIARVLQRLTLQICGLTIAQSSFRVCNGLRPCAREGPQAERHDTSQSYCKYDT